MPVMEPRGGGGGPGSGLAETTHCEEDRQETQQSVRAAWRKRTPGHAGDM